MTEPASAKLTLYTIGHSNHECVPLMELLRRHAITAIADVRSQPYSQYTPQFNRETLESALRQNRIHYVFLGRELGARREERQCYIAGKARYDLIKKLPLFHQGIDRVLQGLKSQRVALLCSEKDPITCHRTILICRHMRNPDLHILHILEDGALESQETAETRLLESLGMPEADLFHDRRELVE